MYNFSSSNKSIFGNKFDIIFLIFPIWIPISYFLLINIYTDNRTFVFFLYLFLLGEMHFASTWLFFTNKENLIWAWQRKNYIFAIPVLIIIIYIIIGLYSLKSDILLGAIFSSYHVNRQSVGVLKLFTGSNFIYLNTFVSIIWTLSMCWLLIGFLRFFLPFYISIAGINYDVLLYDKIINYLICIVFAANLISFFYIIKKTNDIKVIMATLTGILLYSAYSFVDYPQDAIVIGVGIHWCQYLALNGKLYFSKNDRNYLKLILFFVFIIYAFLMSSIQTNFGESYIVDEKLLLIPLSFQVYHYYLDAFIWKFSDPYIRKTVGSKLFNN